MEEDNKSVPDKNKKRKLKTPSQVEALERFYSDHKYPTEQMKAQLAESTGLMEKQVSGWFCHRRLKDKRSVGGETCDYVRHDGLSGVVIQDYCGSSSKEGDNNHFDAREVESKRFIASHKEEEEETDIDSTSSGDGIPLQKRYLPRSHQHPSMNVPCSKNVAMMKHLQMKKTRPSGYLKLKVPVENPAITAVRRQLGRHYLVDGPSLGVEFDPLPPDAFHSPTPEFVGTNEQLQSSMRQEAYSFRTNSQNLDLDGHRSKFIRGSDRGDKNLLEQMHDEYSGEMSPYDDKKPYRIVTRHSLPRNYALADNHIAKYEEGFYNSAQPPREWKVMKRVHNELPPEYPYRRRSPPVETPVWTNQLKSDFPGSAIDNVPSTLSEDETATTPSTED